MNLVPPFSHRSSMESPGQPDFCREAILRQVCMSTPVAKPRYLRHPRRNSSIPGAEERNHGSHATGSTPWPHDSSMAVVSLKMRHFSWHQETPWDEGDCWCHRHQLQHFQTVWFEPPIEPLKMPGLSVPIGCCTTRVIDGYRWLWTNHNQPIGLGNRNRNPGSNSGSGYWSSRWNPCPEAEWICGPGRVPTRSGNQFCSPFKILRWCLEWFLLQKQ